MIDINSQEDYIDYILNFQNGSNQTRVAKHRKKSSRRAKGISRLHHTFGSNRGSVHPKHRGIDTPEERDIVTIYN